MGCDHGQGFLLSSVKLSCLHQSSYAVGGMALRGTATAGCGCLRTRQENQINLETNLITESLVTGQTDTSHDRGLQAQDRVGWRGWADP